MRESLNAEDKLVLSKAQDVIELSDRRCQPTFYGFLNEHESQLIKDNLYTDNCEFWGGYPQAQRVVFGCGVDDYTDFPLKALKFLYKKEYKLLHRDFLGSLMSLGIERSTVGDILVANGQTVVFVKSELADYIIQQVEKIGRVGVQISECPTTDINYKCEFDVYNFTLSSLRLDVFVCAVCSLSRDKSQKLITSDSVSVNHHVVNNVSKNRSVGDMVTIKKYGKFVFTENNGFSKKGKIKISVKHFR